MVYFTSCETGDEMHAKNTVAALKYEAVHQSTRKDASHEASS
jgi:hypothetical protein